jgi:hypothetical protein
MLIDRQGMQFCCWNVGEVRAQQVEWPCIWQSLLALWEDVTSEEFNVSNQRE